MLLLAGKNWHQIYTDKNSMAGKIVTGRAFLPVEKLLNQSIGLKI
ncbi:hypothetical protein [uncultured Mucilaginibacter sp.]|nr:hypothetical protein [uncultured Mucilaginibacter sp.]